VNGVELVADRLVAVVAFAEVVSYTFEFCELLLELGTGERSESFAVLRLVDVRPRIAAIIAA
jgi:hypothetical protein